MRLDGARQEVPLPLLEDAALVAPGPNLPALGRSLGHPKASQKAESTYAQDHTFLLSCHMAFLGNPRAASTWALLGHEFPTGHMDHELQSQHQSARRGVKMCSHRVPSWDAGPKAVGRVQFQRQCQPPELGALIALFLDYLHTYVTKLSQQSRQAIKEMRPH